MKVTYWTVSSINPAPSIFFLLRSRLLVGEWTQIPGCLPFRGFSWPAAPPCNPTELRKLFSNLLVSAAYLSKIFLLVAWPVILTRINHLLVLPLATVCPWPLPWSSPKFSHTHFSIFPSSASSTTLFLHPTIALVMFLTTNQMDTHFLIFCNWT